MPFYNFDRSDIGTEASFVQLFCHLIGLYGRFLITFLFKYFSYIIRSPSLLHTLYFILIQLICVDFDFFTISASLSASDLVGIPSSETLSALLTHWMTRYVTNGRLLLARGLTASWWMFRNASPGFYSDCSQCCEWIYVRLTVIEDVGG